jgi:nuclear transport factor 2 (NTF2) superfamily protein
LETLRHLRARGGSTVYKNDGDSEVRKAEDLWNTRLPQKVALADTPDNVWRNRSEFANGREQIVALLTRKWGRELEYRLIKEPWAFSDDRIAVRFAYEYRDAAGPWYRSYGNENWEFNVNGVMHHPYAPINDIKISESERLYHWPSGRRPDDHPGLVNLDS